MFTGFHAEFSAEKRARGTHHFSPTLQPGRGHGDRRWRPQGHTRFTLAAPGARPGNDPIGDDRVKATLRQHRSQKRQSDKPAHVSWRCDSAGLWATQWDAQCDGLRMVVCVDGGGWWGTQHAERANCRTPLRTLSDIGLRHTASTQPAGNICMSGNGVEG